jgi:hypothetical protein
MSENNLVKIVSLNTRLRSHKYPSCKLIESADKFGKNVKGLTMTDTANMCKLDFTHTFLLVRVGP